MSKISIKSFLFLSGLTLAVSFLLAALAPTAQADLDRDSDSIRSFAGCYKVSYDFAETFALQPGYKMHKPYHADGVEWVSIDRDQPGQITLQHILLTPDGPLKHWSQEWTYEADSLFQYRGNFVWEKLPLTPEKTARRWTQRVYQVDGSPQYECTAPWVQWGSQHYWECQTWSPLPRREFADRSDYNVLVRRNRQSVAANGWMHEQDNMKVLVDANGETPLAKEKGENRYERIADSFCATGAIYWTENRATWHAIQSAWTNVYATQDRLAFIKPAGQPVLWQALFSLADRAEQSRLDRAAIRGQASTIIDQYLAK
jgi:hypothetical protein